MIGFIEIYSERDTVAKALVNLDDVRMVEQLVEHELERDEWQARIVFKDGTTLETMDPYLDIIEEIEIAVRPYRKP